MSSLNMPWWKNSPGHLFFTFSSSSSSPASPSSSAAGGRNCPRDLRFFHWSRRQPRPRLTRQNNLRRLTEHEINALSIDAASSSTPVSQSPGNLDAASSSIPVSQSPSNLVAASSSSPVFRFPSNLDAASNSTPVFRYPSDLDAASSFTPVFRSSSDVDASSSSAPVSQSHIILSTASSSNPVFWSPRDLDTTLSSNPAFRSPRNLDAASSSTPVSRSPSNLDAAPLRSASSPIVLLPRPLPLPERASAVSPHRESTLGRGLGFSPPNPMGCPLPSPLRASGRSEGDDGNRATTKPTSLESVVESRLACQPNCRSPEQVDISLNKSTISDRRKVSHESNSTRTINRLNIPTRSVPISEFSSPIASPIYSPRRLSDVGVLASVVSTPGRQVWSASEIPCMGMMTAFSSQTSPEKRMCSPERSPLCSPTTKSHILRSRNPSAPPSPLHTKMFPESSAAWHDNGGNVNVYPLPLPPGAAPSSQSAFAHQSAAKAEVSVMTNQWQKGKLIGSGTFGNVYEATNRHNGALCAMKEVNIIPDDARSAECLKQLEQEIKFLSQFKHPNIVQYYGSETIEDQLYIYLEYVHPGSISKYVRQYCGALTESVVRNFTRHILEGLIYLHSKNVMHRDIKGANLLVDVNGVVKLADFGMAKHLSGAAPALSVKGSPFWMAPEMLQATMNKEIGYDLAVDIWSLGCTIIEMFTGKHPWSDLQGHQAMFKVLHYDPPIPEKLSSEGKDFLQCCFRRNPAERPTANVLLKHPFIQNSHCYNLHCSFKDFTGIKFVDSTFSPRDRGKSKSSKSDPFTKRTRKPNGENSQCHPEISVSAGSHLSSRSTPVVFPSLSPHSSHTASSPAGASVNTQNNMQFGAGNLLPYALSKPYGKEVVHSF